MAPIEPKEIAPLSWEKARTTRVAVNITEFCDLIGWHRSRFHRHRANIKIIDGYGRPMIPIAEVGRILEGDRQDPAGAIDQ